MEKYWDFTIPKLQDWIFKIFNNPKIYYKGCSFSLIFGNKEIPVVIVSLHDLERMSKQGSHSIEGDAER